MKVALKALPLFPLSTKTQKKGGDIAFIPHMCLISNNTHTHKKKEFWPSHHLASSNKINQKKEENNQMKNYKLLSSYK